MQFQTIRKQQLVILELRGEGRTSVKDGHVGFEEQVEEKEEVTREEVGNVATDSDSGVVVGEVGSWCDFAAGVGRSVSGVMALTRQETSSSSNTSRPRPVMETLGKSFECETGVKRVYINHRSVTRVRDLKYRRITRTKARSMEELREKLREGPMYAKEEGFSHA